MCAFVRLFSDYMVKVVRVWCVSVCAFNAILIAAVPIIDNILVYIANGWWWLRNGCVHRFMWVSEGAVNVCLVAIIPVDARAFIIFNCLIN